MTDREKAIVTAYTGIMMLTGDKMEVFVDYISEKIGRRVMTHELANTEMWDEIKKACSDDFFELCKTDGNTVYVVTQGEYSDYHICGVTTNKKQAEHMEQLYSTSYDEASAEEWLLYMENGIKTSSWDVSFLDDEIQEVFWDGHRQNINRAKYPYIDTSPWTKIIVVHVFAKDEEHAKKIAKDAYMKWKAEQEGV